MANIVRRESGSPNVPSTAWDPFRAMRDLLRWDPFREMAAFGSGEERGPLGFQPRFDVKETKDSYLFKADLPGIKDEDLEISLTGNRLTVSGAREAEQRDAGETYYAYERTYGSFSRTFTLPEGVDDEHVAAELKHGVLTLMVPKKPEVQPKKIEIKAGATDKGKSIKA